MPVIAYTSESGRNGSQNFSEELQDWLRGVPAFQADKKRMRSRLRRLCHLDLATASRSAGRRVAIPPQGRESSSRELAQRPTWAGKSNGKQCTPDCELRIGLSGTADRYIDSLANDDEFFAESHESAHGQQKQYLASAAYHLVVPLSDASINTTSSSSYVASSDTGGACEKPHIPSYREMRDHEGNHAELNEQSFSASLSLTQPPRHWMKRISSVSDQEKNAISAFLSMQRLEGVPDDEASLHTLDPLADSTYSSECGEIFCSAREESAIESKDQPTEHETLPALGRELETIRQRLASTMLSRPAPSVAAETGTHTAAEDTSQLPLPVGGGKELKCPQHSPPVQGTPHGPIVMNDEADQAVTQDGPLQTRTLLQVDSTPHQPMPQMDDSAHQHQAPRRPLKSRPRKLMPRTKRGMAQAETRRGLGLGQSLLDATCHPAIRHRDEHIAATLRSAGRAPFARITSYGHEHALHPAPDTRQYGETSLLTDADRIQLLRIHNAQLSWHLYRNCGGIAPSGPSLNVDYFHQAASHYSPSASPLQRAFAVTESTADPVIAVESQLGNASRSQQSLSLMREWWERFPPRLRAHVRQNAL